MKTINSNVYGLSSRIKLVKKDNRIFILIDRKSRVIMKDGYRIVEIVKKIKLVEAGQEIGVLSSAPVCSKTQKYLCDRSIEITNL